MIQVKGINYLARALHVVKFVTEHKEGMVDNTDTATMPINCSNRIITTVYYIIMMVDHKNSSDNNSVMYSNLFALPFNFLDV